MGQGVHMKNHHYKSRTLWTGSQGQGTTSYEAYSRDFETHIHGKPKILGSSDPHFRGDATRLNPEDMMVSSVSSCHMLWYLHLCAVAGVVVVAYEDEAEGVMQETSHGGHFTQVTLHPKVTITNDSPSDIAHKLHEDAHEMCFIANSVNFEIHLEITIIHQEAS